jgi:hypothetical protein
MRLAMGQRYAPALVSQLKRQRLFPSEAAKA